MFSCFHGNILNSQLDIKSREMIDFKLEISNIVHSFKNTVFQLTC